MKYEINQVVYFLESRTGKLIIESMVIDRIERRMFDPVILYSGIVENTDGDRETLPDDKLFSSYAGVLDDIQTQLEELRNENS